MSRQRYEYVCLWDQVWRIAPSRLRQLLREIERDGEFADIQAYGAVLLGPLTYITDMGPEDAADLLRELDRERRRQEERNQ